MIGVLVVDDDPLVRLGLRDLIASADDMRLVAEAVDGADAVDAVRAHSVDVVLMDLRMPRLDGVAATRAIREGGATVPVIVLTTFDRDTHVTAALSAGADGFLLKDTPPLRILEAVRDAHAGLGVLHPRAASVVIEQVREANSGHAIAARAAIATLTPRERDVLLLLARGETNVAIARALSMQESTVKSHVTRVMAALAVDNRVRVALVARDAGLR